MPVKKQLYENSQERESKARRGLSFLSSVQLFSKIRQLFLYFGLYGVFVPQPQGLEEKFFEFSSYFRLWEPIHKWAKKVEAAFWTLNIIFKNEVHEILKGYWE